MPGRLRTGVILPGRLIGAQVTVVAVIGVHVAAAATGVPLNVFLAVAEGTSRRFAQVA